MQGQEEEGGGGEPEGEAGAPEEGFPGAGRPDEGPKYGKDRSARGRDPLGRNDMKKFDKVGTPMSMESIKNIVKGVPVKTKSKSVISETFNKNTKSNELKNSENQDKETFLDEDKLLDVKE